MLRNKIVKDAALLNMANLLAQGVGIAQRLVVMRFIDPSLYGVWLTALIVLSYSGYAHLGLEHGMGVRLPYYLGKGEKARAEEIAGSVYGAWTILSLMTALGVAGWALIFAQGSLRVSLLAIAAMIVFEQQIQFATRWHSSASINFMLISRLSVARTLLLFLFVVPACYFFGIYGLIAGTMASTFGTLVLWWRAGSFPARPRVSWDVLRELLRFGFPILLVVMLGGLIDSIDRTTIALKLEATALGYYAVTTLGGSSMYGMLAQAGSAMSPHIAGDFGRSGEDRRSLERYLIRPTLIFATIAAILAIGLIFVIPPIVHLLLPRYVPGLPAFRAYVPGFFFLSTIITANTIVNLVLIAQRRQRLILYLQSFALLSEVGLALIAIRAGFGIVGVAAGSTLAYAVYGIGTLSMAAWFVFGNFRRASGFVLTVLIPIVFTGTAAALILWFTRSLPWGEIPNALLRGSVFAFACVPLMFWLQRQTGAWTILSGAARSWLARFRPVGEAAP